MTFYQIVFLFFAYSFLDLVGEVQNVPADPLDDRGIDGAEYKQEELSPHGGRRGQR